MLFVMTANAKIVMQLSFAMVAIWRCIRVCNNVANKRGRKMGLC